MITLITIIIFFIVILIGEFLQDLNILGRGVLIEGLAAVMNNVDLPQVVDDIAVIERAVRVKYENLHFRACCVVPHAGLVNEAPAIDEQDAPQEGVALELLQFLDHVHVRKDWNAIVLHLIRF